MEAISAATTLGKLLSTGYSIFKAVQDRGGDFELDLKAYESLVEVGVLRVDQAAERTRWVERLLVGDMATCDQRHVFGNVRGHQTLPAMPLGRMYVEPNVALRKERTQTDSASPILATLRDALTKHPLVVVTADFGHGKSLTARTLAYETAQAFLNDGSQTSAELERPVFVKCQAAFSTSHIELAQAVRRAQWLALKDDLGRCPRLRASAIYYGWR